jgi:hypothetical protein
VAQGWAEESEEKVVYKCPWAVFTHCARGRLGIEVLVVQVASGRHAALVRLQGPYCQYKGLISVYSGDHIIL